MSQEPGSITVLGLNIAFRPGADMERARQLAKFVEERYEAQKQRYPEGQGKFVLLTILALGLAEDIFQMKKQRQEAENRLEKLLEKIEKSL